MPGLLELHRSETVQQPALAVTAQTTPSIAAPSTSLGVVDLDEEMEEGEPGSRGMELDEGYEGVAPSAEATASRKRKHHDDLVNLFFQGSQPS